VKVQDHLNIKWKKIMDLRGLVNDELDKKRKAGVVKSSQEARVDLSPNQLPAELQKDFDFTKEDWPFIFQMAETRINSNGASSPVSIESTAYVKCDRCWRHRKDVGESKEHPGLCARCVSVMGHLTLSA
jgi:isoleucyl-tRNA synthetase